MTGGKAENPVVQMEHNQLVPQVPQKLTYLLTPSEKLTGFQLVKKFPAF
jgi:hypothetical protein